MAQDLSQTADEQVGNQHKDEQRVMAECSHQEHQHRQFRFQWRVYKPAVEGLDNKYKEGTEYHVSFQPRPRVSLERAVKTLHQFEPEDIRTLCFKDCALYTLTTTASHGFFREQLFHELYRHWFPSRATDAGVNHGSFFCQLLDFRHLKAAPVIGDVLDFHQALCAELHQLLPNLPRRSPTRLSSLPDSHPLSRPQAVGRLRPTFQHCFLAMHAEYTEHSVDGQSMREHGVTIVFLHSDDAARHGCVADEARGITAIDLDGLGEAKAFRCSSLERAMSVVLATDPTRSMNKREWHGRYEDEVLDQNDTTPTDLCRCSGCRPDLKPMSWELRGPVTDPGKSPQLEQKDV